MLAGGMVEARNEFGNNRFPAAEQRAIKGGVIESDERKANFSALQQ